jgi:sarcosine oxidase
VSHDADVVVVGAGIAGAATARSLAGHAGSVVLLEQFDVGHHRGSSHGTSRIFRLNYAEERFVRLAETADAAWRELERERGEPLIDRVGSLDLGPDAAVIQPTLAACGVRHETLSAAEVASRWPLRLDSDETAVFQPDGGVLYADRAYRALLDAGVTGGVEVRPRTHVRSLATASGEVRLTLDDGELAAAAVVVTAGAWATALLGSLGIELPVVVTRETVVYLDLPAADAVPPVIDYGRLPAAGDGIVSRAGQASYGLAAPSRGLKAGIHHSGPEVEASEEGSPDERVARWVSGWAASRYDGAGDVLGAETCLYTNTPDEDFVLERHGRIVVGSACSGHGFKFAPIVGRTLAALAREAAD